MEDSEVTIEKLKNIEKYLNEMEKLFFIKNVVQGPEEVIKELALWYGKISSDYRDVQANLGVYSGGTNVIKLFLEAVKQNQKIKK